MSLLAIDHLTLAFNGQQVVRDVSLTIEKGEILALVGESGSGKSLTAHSILKLLPGNAVMSGNVTFSSPLAGEVGRGGGEGESERRSPLTPILSREGRGSRVLSSLSEREIANYRGNRIGMIFQEPMTALNPLHPIRRQVLESYCLHQQVRPRSARAQQKYTELLASVGLTHLADRGTLYPHQLSGGERQRVMIAMAIANDPDLLIADEPTTALDVTLQRQILDLLRELQRARGMGMLFITHDLLTVRAIADRVAVMQSGKIVETGKVKELFAAPQHPYTKMLLAAAPQGTAAPLKSDAQVILSTENLTVTFPVKSPVLRRTLRVVKAVQNVSFALRQGETIGIVGESGSGKSSLGFALLRLIPSDGPILFLGNRFDLFDKRSLRAARRDAQIVFQDPYSSLNPRLTVGALIAEGLKLHDPKASIDAAVDEIMKQVGLTPEMKTRYPHEFSGGQRQRIAIARAMILKPKFVVLDEPTSALDMSVQRQVLELLRALQASHAVSYLFISHDLRVIRAMAHQVLVLQKGIVVEQGPAADIFAAPQHDYTRTLLAAAFSESLPPSGGG